MVNFVISLPPFQLLANPPSCITTLYTKNTASILCQILIANQENSQCQYTLTNCTQCMAIDHGTFCSKYSHHTYLPWGNHRIYYNKEANSHLAATPSLQCYIAQLPSTPTLCEFYFRSQYFSGHGKPEHDQHIIIRFSYMATLRETLEQDPASTLS